MGLMTAYQAAPLAESVTVLDRSRVGDPATASFGLTRSVRNDYRDPVYEGKTPGVKIGFYNPPDVARTPSRIGSVEQFVEPFGISGQPGW